MKYIIALLTVLAACVVNAQDENSDQGFRAWLDKQRMETLQMMKIQIPKPNEIVTGNVTLSGVVVQCIKTDNQLQLINPYAPPEYGPFEQNVVVDPITGRIEGIKLFSISF